MFGKEKERRRQWALLGKLLRGMRLLEALDFMHAAYGTSVMRWDMLRDAVSRGETLSGLAEGYGHGKIPEEVVAALRKGEKDGRLPQHLEELLEPEAESSDFGGGEAQSISLVDQILMHVIEKKIPRLEISEKGLAAIGIEMPGALIPPIHRRLWIMAGQPYWKPEAETVRTRMPNRMIEFRVSPGPGGVVIVEPSQS